MRVVVHDRLLCRPLLALQVQVVRFLPARPAVQPETFDPEWLGGFYCPCHGSKFDLAGRVYAGVPAPSNMEVPPHFFESDSVVVIGEDEGKV